MVRSDSCPGIAGCHRSGRVRGLVRPCFFLLGVCPTLFPEPGRYQVCDACHTVIEALKTKALSHCPY